jgi:hypothetical protein
VSVLQMLKELRDIGVEVVLQGENLVIQPASRVPPELKARLRAEKPRLLEVLKAEAAFAAARPATCSRSCYEIETGRWIHHSRQGCKTYPKREPRVATQVEVPCWHCHGARECRCIACRDEVRDSAGECFVCHGTGVRLAWIQ